MIEVIEASQKCFCLIKGINCDSKELKTKTNSSMM